MTAPKSTTLEIQIGHTKLSFPEKVALATFKMLNEKDKMEIDAICQALVTGGKTWREAFDAVVLTGLFAGIVPLEEELL